MWQCCTLTVINGSLEAAVLTLSTAWSYASGGLLRDVLQTSSILTQQKEGSVL